MNAPLIVAVDDDPALLAAVERELRTRYAPDYRVCMQRSAAEARATFEELTASGEEVALVLWQILQYLHAFLVNTVLALRDALCSQ